MAEEIEFRFPSGQPYAYVNVRGTFEELANLNLEQLASLYANSLVGFKRYEQAAIDYMASEFQKPAPTAIEVKEQAVSEEAAEADEIIKQGLGATEIDDVSEAPYKQPAAPAKPKPWESKKPAAQVAVDLEDW